MTWITGPNLSQFFISGKKKRVRWLCLMDLPNVSTCTRWARADESSYVMNGQFRILFIAFGFILFCFFVFKRNRPRGRVIHPTKRRRRKKPKRVDAMSFMVSILSSNYTSEELCDSCLLHIDHDQNIEPKIVSHVDSHKSYCVGWQTWNQSTRNQ